MLLLRVLPCREEKVHVFAVCKRFLFYCCVSSFNSVSKLVNWLHVPYREHMCFAKLCISVKRFFFWHRESWDCEGIWEKWQLDSQKEMSTVDLAVWYGKLLQFGVRLEKVTQVAQWAGRCSHFCSSEDLGMKRQICLLEKKMKDPSFPLVKSLIFVFLQCSFWSETLGCFLAALRGACRRIVRAEDLIVSFVKAVSLQCRAFVSQGDCCLQCS